MAFDHGSAQELPAICIPMNVDAFILNEKVCDSGLTRIAPITQPDYRGLRPNDAEIKSDLLPHVDVHYSQPAAINSRVSTVEAPEGSSSAPGDSTPPLPRGRPNRIGAYLHWSLPRGYRAAVSSADTVNEDNQPVTDVNLSPSPVFRLVPNRWLVVRKNISTVPTAPPPPGSSTTPVFAAWLVESDRMWEISDLGEDIDLETDVSPFVSYTKGDENDPDALSYQAGVFIGAKFSIEPPETPKAWSETGKTVPRVPLTTMNSSNFCFTDNTLHNPNVFSMVDNFHYKDLEGFTQTYTSITCNYYVLGWHDSPDDDPLHPSCGGLKGPLRDRLKAIFCNLQLSEEESGRIDIGASTLPSRVLCYGAILGVQYDRAKKPPTPADTYASLFTSVASMEPVSIGTTPLDSMLTFLQAHTANEEEILGPGTSETARNILALRELLYASGDTYNDRIKASDLVYADNFASTAGGRTWHFAGKAAAPGEPPALPSAVQDSNGKSEVDYLRDVNGLQLLYDATNRKLDQVRWDLFSVWWKFVSDPFKDDPDRLADYQRDVTYLRTEVTKLQRLIGDPVNGLTERIERVVRLRHRQGPAYAPKVPVTAVPLPAFRQRKDPTICIAGMDSGWPTKYLNYVPVRLFTSFPRTAVETLSMPRPTSALSSMLFSQGMSPMRAASIQTATAEPLPTSDEYLNTAVNTLLQYMALSTIDHTDEIGFQVWNGQPWNPLFIEWEAIYVHIPFDKWSVGLLNSPVAASNHAQVRYGVHETLIDDPDVLSDTRRASGRIILTPQPVVNLQALVASLLDRASTPQPTDMTAEELVEKIGRLKLTSAEMSGLTENLLTLSDGSHVQPCFFTPGDEEPVPLAAAVAAGSPIGMTASDLALIGDQSGLTPFGTAMDFSTALNEPFKPVTHGQFQFTKLNIIDKFGQVISTIGPAAIEDGDQGSAVDDTLNPCLGDQVCPGIVDGTTYLNTVAPLTDVDPMLPNGYPLCPWVQLTPGINQPARLNAGFVTLKTPEGPTPSGHPWRCTDEWEQPVWGWVVVNYADYGLQFFAADGTFYVEMSLGGPSGTIAGPKWLPFDPPKDESPVDAATGEALVAPQLVQLIEELTETDGYLFAFWDMITRAVADMPYAPADYASYASAIVGKPLGLVNVGISLELASPPLRSQCTLPPDSDVDATMNDVLNYKFPFKVGDKERPFDGVVGYYDNEGAKTLWNDLFTYFTDDVAEGNPARDPRTLIEPSTFPVISPFYSDPTDFTDGTKFVATLAKEMMIKTMIVDPYTPLHLYSPILPIVSLQLPAWTIQSAFQRMSAFFRLGPCLITKDVPQAYDPQAGLEADSWVQKQHEISANPDTAPIRLPVIAEKKATWEWLQPYAVPSNVDDEGNTEDEHTSDQDNLETRFNAFDVGQDDGRIRLDPGPYTLVEGYLQLLQPLSS